MWKTQNNERTIFFPNMLLPCRGSLDSSPRTNTATVAHDGILLFRFRTRHKHTIFVLFTMHMELNIRKYKYVKKWLIVYYLAESTSRSRRFSAAASWTAAATATNTVACDRAPMLAWSLLVLERPMSRGDISRRRDDGVGNPQRRCRREGRGVGGCLSAPHL